MADPEIQEHVFLIEVNKITPNPYQPRREFDEEELKNLASSIREFGILQPLVVTKIVEESEGAINVRYELIAGERRFRAASIIGLERVPAVIKNVALDKERLEMAIVENVQRANLNPIESARAYNRLQDEFKLTQREIAQRIGKSRESIANTMRLLNLPTNIQDAVSMGKLGESQARLLLTIDDIAQQQQLFDEITLNNLSVREVKNKIDYLKSAARHAAQPSTPAVADPEAISIREQLEEALGTAVQVERAGGTGGKITIAFSSPEELYALLQKMTKQNAIASDIIAEEEVKGTVDSRQQIIDSKAGEPPFGKAPFGHTQDKQGDQEFSL
jgi:ParB family chromosome partitioning protein